MLCLHASETECYLLIDCCILVTLMRYPILIDCCILVTLMRCPSWRANTSSEALHTC